jgi:hypothetical protein
MEIDWHFWVLLAITVVIGGLGLLMQNKQISLAEAQLLAAAKKKVAPKVGFFKQYWPLVCMLVLATTSWLPYLLSTHYPPIYMSNWGVWPLGLKIDDPQIHGRVIADGGLLQKYHGDYKLAAVAFFHIASVDAYDEEGLQKSSLYEIRDEPIEIAIPWSDTFRKMVLQGDTGTNYVLLLIPKGVSMPDFETLHQAEALGVKIEAIYAGPP